MSLSEGSARKDAGIHRVTGNNKRWVRLMRSLAERISILQGEVFIDDLRIWADENNCPPESFCDNCSAGTCDKVHRNAWGAIFHGASLEKTGVLKKSAYSSNHAHVSPVWRFVEGVKKPVDTEEWRDLITYWTGDGHDIKYLNISQDVADELGIELPPREETDMTDEQTEPNTEPSTEPNAETATTEPVDNSATFEFKKKKYFDGTECGLKGCSKKLPVEGAYIAGLKPTKGDNGRLWYGPACEKCVDKAHPGMSPDTLAQLAHQRNGASDLALILDIEVGEIQKRLAAAGIDEKGQPLTGGAQQTTVVSVVSDRLIQSLAPTIGDHLAAMESTAIPTAHLATTSTGIQGTLTFLGTFHIQNQQDMDAAGGWLNTVKSQWKDLDELRKSLGKPYRDKATEIQTHFNPVLAQLAQAEGILKQKIDEGQKRANKATQEALQAAQAAHVAGNMQAAGAAQQQVAAADMALPQGVHQRPNIIKFEVVDQTQVPSEYWSVDPAKLQAALTTGVRQINGVRIWEEASLQARQP